MPQERPYPIAVKLSGRVCLVVGGGKVAARKVRDLLDCGAAVEVISPRMCDEFEAYAHRATLRKRAYRPGDEKGAFLVFAATDDPAVNRDVCRIAKEAGALVNVADAPELCDFFVPSKIVRGDLMITLSTGGKAPALSKNLRMELEGRFGPEYGEYLDMIASARETVLLRDDLTAGRRGELINRILDLPLLDLIRSGDAEGAQKEIARCISQS